MAADKFDLLGPALAKVGEEAMAVIGGEPDGVFLYFEVGDGWVNVSLFRDEGEQVRYVDAGDSDISRLVYDAWCLEPADKRWTAMQYTIDHGRFDAAFSFDAVEGTEEDSGDRRERILKARYRGKPIVYPPPPSGWMELKPS